MIDDAIHTFNYVITAGLGLWIGIKLYIPLAILIGVLL